MVTLVPGSEGKPTAQGLVGGREAAIVGRERLLVGEGVERCMQPLGDLVPARAKYVEGRILRAVLRPDVGPEEVLVRILRARAQDLQKSIP